MVFFRHFTNPSLPPRSEDERNRIIVFRRFLGIILMLYTIGLVLDLTFDLKNFGVWTFVNALVLTFVFLVLSILNVSHRYLLTFYFLTILAINQYNFIVSPRAFHVLVYWIGLTPLYMAVLTKPSKIVLWTLVSVVFLIVNGMIINENVGPYSTTVYPIGFIVGSSFFILTTSSIAVFFNYTEKMVRQKLHEKNFQLEKLAKKIEENNEQLKNYNEHLEERVHERTEELERQNHQLAEYAFINSHLVRGPLARVLGITLLMSKTTTTNEQKDLIDHLNKASSELDKVISNINHVLDKEGKIDRRALEKLRDH